MKSQYVQPYPMRTVVWFWALDNVTIGPALVAFYALYMFQSMLSGQTYRVCLPVYPLGSFCFWPSLYCYSFCVDGYTVTISLHYLKSETKETVSRDYTMSSSKTKTPEEGTASSETISLHDRKSETKGTVSGDYTMSSSKTKTPEEGTASSGDTSKDEEYRKQTGQLRHLLKFYFFPAFKYKSNTCNFNLVQVVHLIFQVIKLALITAQIISFGYDRRNFSEPVRRGSKTLKHLMLEGWDASREVPPYPPSQGEFAVYSIPTLESKINYAVSGYYNARRDAIGYYVRMPNDSITLALKYFFFQGFDDPRNDIGIRDDVIHPIFGLSDASSVYTYNISHELASLNITQPFKRLLDLRIQFQLHSVRIFEKNNAALCLRIKGFIRFEDLDNNGQVVVDFNTVTSSIPCSSMNISANDWIFEQTSKSLGEATFAFSLISALLTGANIVFSIYLADKTRIYMNKYFSTFYEITDENETNLSKAEYFKFLKLWDYCQLVADGLTARESYYIAYTLAASGWVLSDINEHSVQLSFGGLLAWLSLLRFFKFHTKFHLLFSTLYKAAFNVLAYLICVTVLFVGFWVCGYVVLSPYHIKFETPAACAETLLSMVHGDEIYATLAILEYKKSGSNVVWWFLRVYILTYVAVFTIVVINLLIAIFMSAYESIREHSKTDGLKIKKGPIEKAIIELMKTTDSKSNTGLRNQFLELMQTKNELSDHEAELRRPLEKLVQVSNDVVKELKPRTIKAFIDDNPEARSVPRTKYNFRCYCFVPCGDCEKD